MLNRKTFFIREHVGLMKLSNTYNILDPEGEGQLGIAQERPGALIQVLRLLVNKQLLPTKVFVYEGNNPDDASRLIFSIQRGFTLLRSKVKICDAQGNVIGGLKSKLLSLGGAFRVFDSSGQQIATVKGDWKGWTFRFLDPSENEIGTITKKWAGLGKELFTSADNYVIALTREPKPSEAILLLAAGLAVDTVYKES
jgi:uncharacterized protein YxjI